MVRTTDDEEAHGCSLLASTPGVARCGRACRQLLADGEQAQGLLAVGEHTLTLLADGPIELTCGVLSWLESLSSMSPYG